MQRAAQGTVPDDGVTCTQITTDFTALAAYEPSTTFGARLRKRNLSSGLHVGHRSP
jgi:hypothetical protein